MGKYKKLKRKFEDYKFECKGRFDKIEKHLGLNTEVTVSQIERVEELPEKWCIKMDNQEVIDYCNENGEIPPYSQDSNLFAQFPSVNRCTSVSWITEGYTEITFDQFKKWVLKEDELKSVEKPLSIREVQVKVSSQEEANECAEIAKACGERIGSEFSMSFDSDNQYFFINDGEKCGCYMHDRNKTKISIQEYRERFGKAKTEIDWSKPGQLVENKNCVVINLGNTNHKCYFDGVVLIKKSIECLEVGTKTRFDKDCFKLCTEPITLKNE